MQLIPHKIHFVWEGSNIPEKYLLNILRQKEQSPKYEVNIWTTKPRLIINTLDSMLHSNHYAPSSRYLAFKHQNNINICSTLSLFRNLYVHHPDGAKIESIFHRELNGCYCNLAAASDITRLAIIFIYGGIYMDVDMVTGPIGSLIVNDDYFFASPDIESNSMVSNAIVAASSGNLFAKKILSNIVCQYYQKQNSEIAWSTKRSNVSVTEPNGRIKGTMEFTGPGYLVGLSKYIKHNLFSEKSLSHQSGVYIVSDPAFSALCLRFNAFYSKHELIMYGVTDNIWGDGKTWSGVNRPRRNSVC